MTTHDNLISRAQAFLSATQAELADIIGVSAAQISQWKNGQSAMSDERVAQFEALITPNTDPKFKIGVTRYGEWTQDVEVMKAIDGLIEVCALIAKKEVDAQRSAAFERLQHRANAKKFDAGPLSLPYPFDVAIEDLNSDNLRAFAKLVVPVLQNTVENIEEILNVPTLEQMQKDAALWPAINNKSGAISNSFIAMTIAVMTSKMQTHQWVYANYPFFIEGRKKDKDYARLLELLPLANLHLFVNVSALDARAIVDVQSLSHNAKIDCEIIIDRIRDDLYQSRKQTHVALSDVINSDLETLIEQSLGIFKEQNWDEMPGHFERTMIELMTRQCDIMERQQAALDQILVAIKSLQRLENKEDVSEIVHEGRVFRVNRVFDKEDKESIAEYYASKYLPNKEVRVIKKGGLVYFLDDGAGR